MRWLIKHITVTYADRALLAPGSHIADSSASLAWSYGTETVERVGSTRPAIRDRGNASGTLSLPIVRDFPDFESAMAELIENKAWANAHTTGQLSLAVTDPQTGAPPSALPDGGALVAYIVLSAERMAKHIGTLQKISFPCPPHPMPGMETWERYLGVWEAGDDGYFRHIATSLNTQIQAPSRLLTWYFPAVRLTGRALMLHPVYPADDRPGPGHPEDGPSSHYSSLYVYADPTEDGSYVFEYTGDPISSDAVKRNAAPRSLAISLADAPVDAETSTAAHELHYTAALTAFNTDITLTASSYRLTTTYEFTLT